MEFKQLQSLVAVVQYKSFTKAAEKTFISQPTISTHIRTLEEELKTQLIVRTTKNIDVTPKGWELYDCAVTILGLRDNLLQRWTQSTKEIIHLGASTIPSAYVLPEILPLYGKTHPDTYFIIHQSDSGDVAESIENGVFDLGLIGMNCESKALSCLPFYRDRMVLITPVSEKFLALKQAEDLPVEELLKEPMILREQGSGSKKSVDAFLESIEVGEGDLNVMARINDQESIKNLVASGVGISIISEKAAKNFVDEKRLLAFDLPGHYAVRQLYLLFRRDLALNHSIRQFVEFVRDFYGEENQ